MAGSIILPQWQKKSSFKNGFTMVHFPQKKAKTVYLSWRNYGRSKFWDADGILMVNILTKSDKQPMEHSCSRGLSE
jgi:hypothetical protein